MNIHSDYLEKDLDIDVTEIKDGEDENAKVVMRVVTHDSLRKIFMSEKLLRLTYEYQPVYMDRGHYAVLCKMSDTNGRVVQEIGESLPATLTNQISKNYPILMAYQRAFDRALIAILGLEGKILSDAEIPAGSNISIPKIMDDSALLRYEKGNSEESVSDNERNDLHSEEVESYEEFSTDKISEPSVIPAEIEDDEPTFEDATYDESKNGETTAEKILNGKKWNQKFYGKSIYLDGEKIELSDEDLKVLKEYVGKNKK